MRNRKVIAYTRKNQNLFIPKLAQLGRAMTIINTKVMIIYRRRQLTYLVSQNKCIRLW